MGQVILATLAFSVPSFANVMYQYSGHNATNSEGTSAASYVPLHAPMTFEFSVAAPLAANLTNVNILSSVLSWDASGGTALSTITSTDPNPWAHVSGFGDLIRVTTDSSGLITAYRVLLAAELAVQPTTEAYFLFEHSGNNYDETFMGYSIPHGGSAIVSATCSGTGACAGDTTISVITADTPTTVPEPATLALLAIGGALTVLIRLSHPPTRCSGL